MYGCASNSVALLLQCSCQPRLKLDLLAFASNWRPWVGRPSGCISRVQKLLPAWMVIFHACLFYIMDTVSSKLNSQYRPMGTGTAILGSLGVCQVGENIQFVV